MPKISNYREDLIAGEKTKLAPYQSNSLTIGTSIAGSVLLLILAVLIGYAVKKLWVLILMMSDQTNISNGSPLSYPVAGACWLRGNQAADGYPSLEQESDTQPHQSVSNVYNG
mgnify:CR=1 FL=1